MGQDGHVLTFPVDHGQILNIVAFKNDDGDWPDPNRMTRSAKQEDMLLDFAGFGPAVTRLLRLTKADLEVVRSLE